MRIGRLTLYVAGGFRSGWQKEVHSALPEYDILDPSAQQIRDPEEYTEWDLDAIRRSDVVLANMEATNPGGYSLALEVGFAKALGKRIVLVDQISDPAIKRYFEMVRQSSDVVFGSLTEAIEHLNTIA